MSQTNNPRSNQARKVPIMKGQWMKLWWVRKILSMLKKTSETTSRRFTKWMKFRRKLYCSILEYRICIFSTINNFYLKTCWPKSFNTRNHLSTQPKTQAKLSLIMLFSGTQFSTSTIKILTKVSPNIIAAKAKTTKSQNSLHCQVVP